MINSLISLSFLGLFLVRILKSNHILSGDLRELSVVQARIGIALILILIIRSGTIVTAFHYVTHWSIMYPIIDVMGHVSGSLFMCNYIELIQHLFSVQSVHNNHGYTSLMINCVGAVGILQMLGYLLACLMVFLEKLSGRYLFAVKILYFIWCIIIYGMVQNKAQMIKRQLVKHEVQSDKPAVWTRKFNFIHAVFHIMSFLDVDFMELVLGQFDVVKKVSLNVALYQNVIIGFLCYLSVASNEGEFERLFGRFCKKLTIDDEEGNDDDNQQDDEIETCGGGERQEKLEHSDVYIGNGINEVTMTAVDGIM